MVLSFFTIPSLTFGSVSSANPHTQARSRRHSERSSIKAALVLLAEALRFLAPTHHIQTQKGGIQEGCAAVSRWVILEDNFLSLSHALFVSSTFVSTLALSPFCHPSSNCGCVSYVLYVLRVTLPSACTLFAST